MSYTIEFNRQFIKSSLGITPCWLAGDNNVTSGYGRRERVHRSWNVFRNLIGVTEQDIIDRVTPSLNGYQEHWKRNGKFLDDAGLLRWIHNGCKNAASIEAIRELNNLRGIPCHLSVWSRDSMNCRKELCETIKDTASFDDWIVRARERIDFYKSEGEHCAYPEISFIFENLQHPVMNPKIQLRNVILKYRDKYLCAYTEDSTSWSSDACKALEFTYDDAVHFRELHTSITVRNARMISASIKDFPYDAVIRIDDGAYDGRYIRKRKKGSVEMVYDIRYAKHYKNVSEAKRVAEKLKSLYERVGSTLVVEQNILSE